MLDRFPYYIPEPYGDLSTDAVGSTAFHPLESCLLSASGSRHFIDEEEVEASEDDLSDLDADADGSSDGCGGSDSHSHLKGSNARRERRRHPVTLDSTLKLWNLGMRSNKRQF